MVFAFLFPTLQLGLLDFFFLCPSSFLPSSFFLIIINIIIVLIINIIILTARLSSTLSSAPDALSSAQLSAQLTSSHFPIGDDGIRQCSSDALLISRVLRCSLPKTLWSEFFSRKSSMIFFHCFFSFSFVCWSHFPIGDDGIRQSPSDAEAKMQKTSGK